MNLLYVPVGVCCSCCLIANACFNGPIYANGHKDLSREQYRQFQDFLRLRSSIYIYIYIYVCVVTSLSARPGFTLAGLGGAASK
jgi:hypothetical protein